MMKLEQTNDGRWGFTGRVPMELAGAMWRDRFKAIAAANRNGFDVMADGSCVDARCNDPDAPVNLCSGDDLRRGGLSEQA